MELKTKSIPQSSRGSAYRRRQKALKDIRLKKIISVGGYNPSRGFIGGKWNNGVFCKGFVC